MSKLQARASPLISRSDSVLGCGWAPEKIWAFWVPLWQAALKDTRSRHKRPPPRCADPLHLFRFAALASLTAACQSGGRVTVICVRKILRICDPHIGNLTTERWRMELATAAGCF